jgi:hypothetical protein
MISTRPGVGCLSLSRSRRRYTQCVEQPEGRTPNTGRGPIASWYIRTSPRGVCARQYRHTALHTQDGLVPSELVASVYGHLLTPYTQEECRDWPRSLELVAIVDPSFISTFLEWPRSHELVAFE